RIQSAYLHTPILEAFDAILNTPTSTVAGGGDRWTLPPWESPPWWRTERRTRLIIPTQESTA
ncbi:hypothetical protein AB4212_19755, partial [Streptomyces sp. 2MCAF27]